MHTHQSLFKGKKNAFFDPKDKYHLSEVAKRYIAGLMKYAREITLVTKQWVNSYKRYYYTINDWCLVMKHPFTSPGLNGTDQTSSGFLSISQGKSWRHE